MNQTYQLRPDLRSRPRAEISEEGVGAMRSRVHRDPRLGYVRSVPRATLSREFDELEPEIIGDDKREAVTDTTAVPYRWICYLELNFGPDPTNPGNDLIGRGTGTLISARHVLTAGHNLYNDFPDIAADLKRHVVSIRVMPGYNCAGKVAAPFGSARASSWASHAKWLASMDMQFDYGLITLDRAIGDQNQAALGNRPLGFWSSTRYGESTLIAPKSPSFLRGVSVNISGYPGDKCCFKPFDPDAGCSDASWAGAQFRSYEPVTDGAPARAPRLILYSLDTKGGHSGAPVWLRWKQYRNLIAIHTGPAWPIDASLRGKANRGVRITDEVLSQVRSWM